MQCLERFLDRRLRVPAVNLVQIDVVGPEPAQARVDRREDGLARQPASIGSRAHRKEHLGGDHQFVAAGIILQCLSDDLLRRTVRIRIGGVEEIDPEVDGFADQWPALMLGQSPRVISALGNSVSHASEAQRRHLKAGIPEIFVLHDRSIISDGCEMIRK